jgi:two-component system sensor kinase FixL
LIDDRAGVHKSFRYLVPVVILVGLHVASLYNYVLFHALVEIVRVVVLFGIFVLAWHARRWHVNSFVLFVGTAYLFVGFLELLHALAYRGMGVFSGDDADLPTQLWIAFRALESVSLLAAFALHQRLTATAAFLCGAVITAAILAAIYAGVFPACFVDGVGLTPFKIVSEYVICALFLAAVVPMARSRVFDRSTRLLLVASLVTAAAAELAFTQYVGVYGLANEIGHLLLFLSTYFLYRAVLVASLVNPFSALFGDLKASEARFALLANAAREGILICDGLRIREANASAARLFGHAEGELTGRSLAELFAVDRRDDTLAKFDDGVATFETVGLREDGATFPVALSTSHIAYDGRHMRIGFVHDLSDEKRADDERRLLQAEVAHAQRLSEIGQMVAALAHELNQPLTAVATYLGACRRLIANGSFDELGRKRLHDAIELAGAQAVRAGDTIRRIREFIGTGHRERTMEDAGNLIREALALASVDAGLIGVTVKSDLAGSDRVLVNRIQIQQVVVNLVRNAVEAMEDSPRKELDVRLTSGADGIEVSVADTGPGLATEIAARLFKPFSTTKKKGMGIGLSVCREIVEAHHGKIWVEPNPAGGTVFRFTLPRVNEEMAVRAVRSPPVQRN